MLQKAVSRSLIYALTHLFRDLFVIGMIVTSDIESWSLFSKCKQYHDVGTRKLNVNPASVLCFVYEWWLVSSK